MRYLPEVGEQDVPETNRESMEVYIDGMLVKSTEAELHIAHLAEAFQILKEYNMKLNPAKCASGVSVEKILGFYIQQPRNRGKPRQDKSCARHATTLEHKRSPTPNWKNSYAKPFCVQGQR